MKKNLILLVVTALTGFVATIPKAEKAQENDAAIKQMFWTGTAYDVGYLTLIGCPVVWHDCDVITAGYLSVLPGGGLTLTMAPPTQWEIAARCSLGVGLKAEKHERDSLAHKTGQAEWLYCRVSGKFTVQSSGGVPNFLGRIEAATVTILKTGPGPKTR